MELKVNQIAQIVGGTVEGNGEAVIKSMARIESGRPGSICFYANPKYEQYVYGNKAEAIIVNRDFVPTGEISSTLIRVDDAYSAVATLLDYATAQKKEYRRHRALTARIRLSAKLGRKVYVGDFSYIGRKARIGDRTKIYEQVFVGDNVTIGSGCIIYPGVKIYPGMEIGNNVILHSGVVVGADGFGFARQDDGTYKKIPHTGKVVIEDNVELGANTCVDKSQIDMTVVRSGVKVDNLVQIAHNVSVGENTVICAQTGIAGSTKIGEGCVITGQVGIANGLTIAPGSTIGAKSGVVSSIKEPGKQWFGCPAIPYGEFMRSYVIFRKNGRAGVKDSK